MHFVASSRVFSAIFTAMAFVAAADTAIAQQYTDTAIPQIVVSGSSDVNLPPAKAAFSISITTTGPSSAAASEDNARISKAVLDALDRRGLKGKDITGSHLSVNPRWDYDPKTNHRTRNGFEAINTLNIDTEMLSQIGDFIDAALTAGATGASQVAFSAKDTEGARHQALSQAVEAARADAETIARAGGGTLGELLLLSTVRANESRGVGLEGGIATAGMAAPQSVSTDVIPGQIKISATVLAHWRFIPASPGK